MIAHGQETESGLCVPRAGPHGPKLSQGPAPGSRAVHHAGSRAGFLQLGLSMPGGARAGTQQAGRGRGVVHRQV